MKHSLDIHYGGTNYSQPIFSLGSQCVVGAAIESIRSDRMVCGPAKPVTSRIDSAIFIEEAMGVLLVGIGLGLMLAWRDKK